jgi:hypothetical protein
MKIQTTARYKGKYTAFERNGPILISCFPFLMSVIMAFQTPYTFANSLTVGPLSSFVIMFYLRELLLYFLNRRISPKFMHITIFVVQKHKIPLLTQCFHFR